MLIVGYVTELRKWCDAFLHLGDVSVLAELNFFS